MTTTREEPDFLTRIPMRMSMPIRFPRQARARDPKAADGSDIGRQAGREPVPGTEGETPVR